MSRTNRIPSGFLDLVGAETGGKTPALYPDAIAPSVNLSELYLGQTLGSFTDTFATASEGQVNDMFVPANEAWLLRGLSCVWSVGVATTGFKLHVQLPNLPRQEQNAFPAIWTSDRMAGFAVGRVVIQNYTLPEPLLLLSGQNLQWRITLYDGPSVTLRVQAMFNRLRQGVRP